MHATMPWSFAQHTFSSTLWSTTIWSFFERNWSDIKRLSKVIRFYISLYFLHEQITISTKIKILDYHRFWREEFSKTMDSENFERMYAQSVRYYNYKKEQYSPNCAPHSCIKIISKSMKPNEYGCPFKTLQSNALRARLLSHGFIASDAQEIVLSASKEHYQIACTKYFGTVHNQKLNKGICHPNQYFLESQKIMKGSKNMNTTSSDDDSTSVVFNQMLSDEFDSELCNITKRVELEEASRSSIVNWNKTDDGFEEIIKKIK